MATPHWTAVAALLVAAAMQSPAWQADRGDGTYRNPILYADYSDPDAIRIGDDFCMISSSFTASPRQRRSRPTHSMTVTVPA